MTRRRGDGVRGGLVGAIRPRPTVAAVAAAAGGVELGLDEVARKSNHKERLKCERIVFSDPDHVFTMCTLGTGK